MRELEQRRKQEYYERRQAQLRREMAGEEDPIKPSRFRKRWVVLGLLIVVALVFTYGFYDSNMKWTMRHLQVASPRISNSFNGFKIAVVSDLHSKDYGDANYDMVKALETEKPDIIVITGDLIDSESTDDSRAISFVEHLARKFPVYYISGNHEQHREMLQKETPQANPTTGDLWTQLESVGVNIVENKSVTIRRLGSKLTLTGLREDYQFYRENGAETTLPVGQYVNRANTEDYQILLAHNPFYWQDYQDWGADLTISGHVHGGGIWLPIVGGLLSPEGSLFPKYDRGLYEENGAHMVVSAGLGNSGIPFRMFNKPELVIVQLKSLNVK